MTTGHDTTAASLSAGDRARIAWALLRVNAHLEGRVSGRRKRAIRKELRANLEAAAQGRGARDAIDRLGDLRALAHSFVDAEVSGVRWWAGTVASQLAIVLLAVGTGLFHAGFTAAVKTLGSDRPVSYSYELWEGFGPLRGTADPAAGVYEAFMFTPFHLAAIVVVYVIAARLWRWRPGE